MYFPKLCCWNLPPSVYICDFAASAYLLKSESSWKHIFETYDYIIKFLISLRSKFWNHFVGDHDIGLSKALATKVAQWSENDIASEDFEQTSFKFGGFKLARSLFFLIFL